MKIKLDKSTLITILSRASSAVLGVLVLFLLSQKLTQVEQGYYFTFYSVLALQFIFDLGFSTIIKQFVGSEVGKYKLALKCRNDGIAGSITDNIKLLEMIRFIIKWYSLLVVVISVILIVIGLLFFKQSEDNVNWFFPWIVIVIFTAVNLFNLALLSVCEGLDKILQVSKVILLQSLIAPIGVIIALYLDLKLYSPSVGLFIKILISFFGILYIAGPILRTAFCNASSNSFVWKKDMLPMQWRMFVSILCGYIILQLFTPLSFKFLGAIYAGQIGLSLNVIQLIVSISSVVYLIKIPIYSSLIGENKVADANQLFRSNAKISFSLLATIFIIFLSFIYLSTSLNLPYLAELSSRFLPLKELFLLCIAYFIYMLFSSLASFSRCFREELFLKQSIFTSLFIIIGFSLTITKFQGIGLILTFLCVNLLYCLPNGYKIYTQQLKEKIN